MNAGASADESHDMSVGGHDQRNIVLTGFMGTGKTTVGRVVATRLGFEFIDTDVIIESRHGPITTIFADQGEEAFRAFERGVADELAERNRLVIATGGGMMLDPANVRSLSRSGQIFCLVATPDAILTRVANDDSRVERPLLDVADPHRRIIELLADRAAGYRRFAQVTTDARSPDAIADELIALARSHP